MDGTFSVMDIARSIINVISSVMDRTKEYIDVAGLENNFKVLEVS